MDIDMCWIIVCFFTRKRCRNKDRKSTRLNSSHGYISYAVFCLKKKKRNVIDELAAQKTPSLAAFVSGPFLEPIRAIDHYTEHELPDFTLRNLFCRAQRFHLRT